MPRLLTSDEIRLLPRKELENYVLALNKYMVISDIRKLNDLFKNDVEKDGTNEERAVSSVVDLQLSDMEARLQNMIDEIGKKAWTYYGPRNEENDR